MSILFWLIGLCVVAGHLSVDGSSLNPDYGSLAEPRHDDIEKTLGALSVDDAPGQQDALPELEDEVVPGIKAPENLEVEPSLSEVEPDHEIVSEVEPEPEAKPEAEMAPAVPGMSEGSSEVKLVFPEVEPEPVQAEPIVEPNQPAAQKLPFNVIPKGSYVTPITLSAPIRGAAAKDKTIEYAVEHESPVGLTIKLPYYRNIRVFPEELQKSLASSSIKILHTLVGTIYALLDKAQSGSETVGNHWIYRMKEMRDMAYAVAIRNQKKIPFKARKYLSNDMYDMFTRIKDKSAAVEKDLVEAAEEKDLTKLKKDIYKFEKALDEALELSPTAYFVGWAQGKVDDVAFENHAAQLIGRVRYHGVGIMDNIFEYIIQYFNPKFKGRLAP